MTRRQPRSPNPSITEPLGLGMQARPCSARQQRRESKSLQVHHDLLLDYGQDSANAIDVTSMPTASTTTGVSQRNVPWPRACRKVQTRASWEFYAGASSDGAPVWTADITQKIPCSPTPACSIRHVRTGLPALPAGDCAGGVTYDAPLQKYILLLVLQHPRTL